jgi:hypothetical protein
VNGRQKIHACNTLYEKLGNFAKGVEQTVCPAGKAVGIFTLKKGEGLK